MTTPPPHIETCHAGYATLLVAMVRKIRNPPYLPHITTVHNLPSLKPVLTGWVFNSLLNYLWDLFDQTAFLARKYLFYKQPGRSIQRILTSFTQTSHSPLKKISLWYRNRIPYSMLKSSQIQNLSTFAELISTSPSIQRKVKICQNFKEICLLAKNYDCDIEPSTLRYLKDDLGAPYWPWTKTRKILS